MSTPSMPSSPRPRDGWIARLRYRFDLALSRGPSVVIGWLGMLTVGIIAVTAVVVVVLGLGKAGNGNQRLGYGEALWQSMLRVVDAGTFAGDSGWSTRVTGLLITICGIFIAGSLIGLIANAVDQRIDELRKGRSRVLENDHTLILGWSSSVSGIVSELVIANESRKKAAIVVLSTTDKTVMEDVLRDAVPDMRSTRVVCRSGEPWMPRNLEMVNVATARSIVVVSEGSDAETVKVLLALRAGDSPPAAHVVAEVATSETGTTLRALMGSDLVTVSSDDVIAELAAQACRQRGLSSVFRELLDFDGDELYFAEFPALVGSTYGQTLMAFESSSIIGVMRSGGNVELNPATDSLIGPGDQLIGISQDDSLFSMAEAPVSGRVLEVRPPSRGDGLRRIVIAGWSPLGFRVVEELDEFLTANTTIEILVDPERVSSEGLRAQITTKNVAIEVSEISGGPEVVARHAARRSFHEVIVLGDRADGGVDTADARTLLTLVAFRHVRRFEDVGPVRMVAELLDPRNAPLAVATGADDFIVSNELTSLMLAQLSERRELELVFADLFDRDGCSIELREAVQYSAHHAVNFGEIVATASTLGQSAIGYRRAATGELVMNPAKSAALSLAIEDEVLVVAPGQV